MSDKINDYLKALTEAGSTRPAEAIEALAAEGSKVTRHVIELIRDYPKSGNLDAARYAAEVLAKTGDRRIIKFICNIYNSPGYAGIRDILESLMEKVSPGVLFADMIKILSASEKSSADSRAAKETLEQKFKKKELDMSTLFDISKELNSSLKIDPLINIILLTCVGQLMASRLALFLEKESGSGVYEFKAGKGCGEKEFDGLSINSSDSLYGIFTRSRKPMTSAEIRTAGAGDGFFFKRGLELGVPLIGKNMVMGFLFAGSKMTELPYSPEDIEFLSILSSQAASAIQNARLYEDLEKTNAELDKKITQLSTLYEVSKIINSTSEIDEVLKLTVETMSTGFDVKAGTIMILNAATGNLETKRAFGIRSEKVCKLVQPKNSGIFGTALELGELIPVENLADFTEIYPLFTEQDKKDIEGLLCVPLNAGGRLLGVLNIFKLANMSIFDKNTQQLFAIIASQLAPPIFMALLIREKNISEADTFAPFLERLEREIKNVEAYDQNLSVVSLRVGNFRSLYERFGSAKTADFISDLLSELRRLVKSTDIIYRYGRDRISIMVPGSTQEEAADFTGRIKGEISGFNCVRNAGVQIKFDIKCVTYPDEGKNAVEIINALED